MKQHLYWLGMPLLLIVTVGLAGCGSRGSTTNDGEGTTPIYGTQKPLVTPTMSSVPGLSTTDADVAPSYDEIKRHIESITKTPDHPDGPEVGLDGIVDPKINAALAAYQQYLVGKKVNNWEGWLIGLTDTGNSNPSTIYNVSLAMKEQRDYTDVPTDVLIYEFPTKQMEKLRLWQEVKKDPQQRFGSCNSFCQKVVFSGTIIGMQSDGQVYVNAVTIKPVD